MNDPKTPDPRPLDEYVYDGEATLIFYPFAYLLTATQNAVDAYALTIQHDQGRGANYHLVTAVVFAAFSVEAAFNHIGGEKVTGWDDWKRWQDKLPLVAAAANVPVDLGKKPFQRVKAAFQFRDKMAHGKTTVQTRTYRVLPGKERPDTSNPDWLAKYFDPDEVKKVVADVRELIESLLAGSGYPPLSSAQHGVSQSKETPRLPQERPKK